jgi:pimeloyl-ACP methyl ester carboxylesterase
MRLINLFNDKAVISSQDFRISCGARIKLPLGSDMMLSPLASTSGKAELSEAEALALRASRPVIVLVPCLSGAPWSAEQRRAFAPYETRTFRLNEVARGIETHVDDLLEQIEGLRSYVLIGDSFGAQVALAAAVRRPAGLVALVISGGFAANPIDNPIIRLKAFAARFMPGPLFNHLVIPMHARLLASTFDDTGNRRWTLQDSIALFRQNTSWRGYLNRTQASLKADYRPCLKDVAVPTLIITPEDDRLIGKSAAHEMLESIPTVREVILRRSGHMLRFSHPSEYAAVSLDFLASLPPAY